MLSAGVLRQPRGPPIDEGGSLSWRTQNGIGQSPQTSFDKEEAERKPSISSEYGAESPKQETSSFGFGEEEGEEQVYMTCVQSTGVIWAQKSDSTSEEELQQLTSKLQVFCSNRPLLQKAPIRNKVYGGIYVGDSQWYRCRILEFVNPVEVKVLFIDFGNTEILRQNQIVQLSSELYNYNAFAKQLKLRGVEDITEVTSEKYAKGTELLNTMLIDKLLTVKNILSLNDKIGTCLVDVAYQENGREVDVNQEMRNKGFSAPILTPTTVRTQPVVNNTKTTPSAQQTITKPTQNGTKAYDMTREQNGDVFTTPKSPFDASERSLKKMQELEDTAKNQAKTIETLKQLCMQLERSKKVELEDAKNKLNEHLNNAVSKKVSQLLKCVSQVRKQRRESSASGNSALRVVLDSKKLLQGDEIDLQHMEELKKVREAESNHENLQETIRKCLDKSLLEELVSKRDQARQDLHDSISALIKHVGSMGLDVFKAKLEVAKSSLKLHTPNTDASPESVTREKMLDDVNQYEDFMSKKDKSLKEMHDLVNQKCKTLSDVYKHIIQTLDLEEDVDDTENCNIDDLDNIMVLLEALIQEETAKSKCSDCEVKLRANAVSSSLSEITKQLHAINELSDSIIKHYALVQDKLSTCKDSKPDINPALSMKKKIRGLKSTLRRKLLDKDDMKETECFSEEDTKKLEEELSTLYNELHTAFVEEDSLTHTLAKHTQDFPELPLSYPDLGIASCLETNGLVKNSRGDENYCLEETIEPGIFVSNFLNTKCYIKEYLFRNTESKDKFQTRAVQFHNLTCSQLIKLDALFYSKNGRTAYLQVPYYQSLEEWLKTTPSSDEIMAVIKDVLQALQAIHSNNLVHAEVTSANVFVSKQDEVITRGILGHYDFSEDVEQRLSSTTSKIDGLPADPPSCSKFDVMCLGQLLKSISDMKLLNEDAELQSLVETLLPSHTTCVPTAKQVLDMSFFHKTTAPVEEQLD